MWANGKTVSIFANSKTKEKNSTIKFQKKIFNTQTYTPVNRINFNEVKVEIVFLNSAKTFKNLPHLKFTNKKNGIEVDSQTIICLQKLLANPDIIRQNSTMITIDASVKGNRIRKILKEFLDEQFVDNHEYCFRKSPIQDDLDVTNWKNGKFRVICLYRIKPPTHKKEKLKHYLEVVLLDLYHLFIPSKLKIEDKKTKEVRCLTSNEAMLETYETVKDYSDNFSLEL